MYIYPLPLPPLSPPTHPRPFTYDEQEELRKIAREIIAKRQEQDKKQRLEQLADELGFELTPRGQQ